MKLPDALRLSEPDYGSSLQDSANNDIGAFVARLQKLKVMATQLLEDFKGTGLWPETEVRGQSLESSKLSAPKNRKDKEYLTYISEQERRKQ